MSHPNGADVPGRADREERVCPFPGFRPFEAHETAYFFGRRQPAYDIIDRLRNTSFLAVVGASGSGKSSLVRCGVIPGLHGGLMGAAGSRWRVATSRPRNAPIRQLAGALAASGLWPREEDTASLIEAALRRNPHGLIDVVEQSELGPDDNVLVVVDQFEELFRFGDETAADDRSREDLAFVQLLLEAAADTREGMKPGARRKRAGIFILVTMRSDMLGRCSSYPDLARWVNDGFYLTPLLDREQRREIIEGPVAIAGAGITARLVNRLLNDAGDDPAMLPPLQHALRRTWMAWEQRTGGLPTPDGREPEPLDIDDYGAASTDAAGEAEENPLRAHLDAHLEEVYASLSERRRKIAERVFRRLTETLPEGQQVRRSATVRELAAVCGVAGDAPEDLRAVLDAFRREGRTFLVPRHGSLESDTLVDISHESLIPSWRRLRDDWMVAEGKAAATYRALSDAAARWLEGARGLLGFRELRSALAWKRAFPTDVERVAWAAPHDRRARRPGGYGQAVQLLERSRVRLWLRVGGAVAVLGAVAWYGSGRWSDIQEQRRIAERRQQLQTATALTDRDPLLGATMLADLADEDDVDGLGFALAMRLLGSETLPVARITEYEAINDIAFDTSGVRMLVTGETGGRWVAAWHRADTIVETELIYEGAPLAAAWPRGGGGVLVGGERPEAVPEGWTFRAIDRGWTRATRSPGNAWLGAVYPVGPDPEADPAHVCLWNLDGQDALDPCGTGDARRISLPVARRLAFPSNSSVIAWGAPGTDSVSHVAVVDLVTGGTDTLSFTDLPGGGTDEVLEVAYRPDRRLLVAGLRSGVLRLADLGEASTSTRVTCDIPLPGRPLALAFLPDGTLASASDDGHIQIREVSAVEPDTITGRCGGTGVVRTVRDLLSSGAAGALVGAQFDSDGWVWAFGREGGRVFGWSLGSAAGAPSDPRRAFRGHPSRVVLARADAEHRRVATADASGEVRVWDRERPSALSTTVDSLANALQLAVSDDGSRLAWTSQTDTAELAGAWDLGAGARLGGPDTLPLVDTLAVDGAGDHYATASEGTVVVRRFSDPPDSEPVRVSYDGLLVRATFTTDGRILTATDDGTIVLSPTRPDPARSETDTLAVGPGLQSAGISSGGLIAVATGDELEGAVRVWGRAGCGSRRWCPVSPPFRRAASVNQLSFSPDGRTVLARYTDSTFALVADAPSWESYRPVVLPLQPVADAAFLSDSVILTTVMNLPGVLVWKLGPTRPGARPVQILLGRIETDGGVQPEIALATGSEELITYGPGRPTNRRPLGWTALARRLRTLTAPLSRQERR